MRDSLVDLETFVRIAETGSLTAAATELGHSLTAVSRRLARFEERLGVRLVNRTTRRLSLTDEGVVLQARALRILADVEEAEAEVSRGHEAAVGRLRVTTTFAFGRRFLAGLCHEFERQHPRLTIHLEATDRVVDLVDGGFDLAIRFGFLPDSSLIARALVANEYVLCAAPAYLDRRGRPAAIEELPDHDAIVFGTPVHDVWAFADGRKVQVRGGLTTNDGDLAHSWAVQGAGIIHKAIWEVADDVREKRLEIVLPDHPLPGAPIHAIFPHNRLTAARVRLFIDFLSRRLTTLWADDVAPALAEPHSSGEQ